MEISSFYDLNASFEMHHTMCKKSTIYISIGYVSRWGISQWDVYIDDVYINEV